MQTISQNSNITILMKVLTASRAAVVHSHSSRQLPILPPCWLFHVFLPSLFLSFLLYLPGRDAELVEESGRHSLCLTHFQECRSMPCHAICYLCLVNVRGGGQDLRLHVHSPADLCSLARVRNKKLYLKPYKLTCGKRFHLLPLLLLNVFKSKPRSCNVNWLEIIQITRENPKENFSSLHSSSLFSFW